MIRPPLLEMGLFSAAKETEQKLRWDAWVDDVKFSLYIPKWRVPTPWPSRIWVDVVPRRVHCDDLPNVTHLAIGEDSSLRNEPIVATVFLYSRHSKTTRYRPVGDQDHWEIGEPYVPHSLTAGDSARLRLLVLWDLTSRGEFI